VPTWMDGKRPGFAKAEAVEANAVRAQRQQRRPLVQINGYGQRHEVRQPAFSREGKGRVDATRIANTLFFSASPKPSRLAIYSAYQVTLGTFDRQPRRRARARVVAPCAAVSMQCRKSQSPSDLARLVDPCMVPAPRVHQRRGRGRIGLQPALLLAITPGGRAPSVRR
jgi:hypothetical protein